MDLEPLQPVEGGVVDPSELVGRERETRALLRAIADGGAYIVGDRRMGKTSLLRKAKQQLEGAGHIVVYVSAETSQLATFTDSLLQAIRSEGRLGKRWAAWTKDFEGEVTLGIAGQGLRLKGSVKRGAAEPETDLLALCAEATRRSGAPSLVIMIDEIAQLAYFLAESDPSAGEEFLRTLRRVRQARQPNISVVLAGSVGLHHAVNDTTVLNDLPRVSVGPLADSDATLLARRLLLGVFGQDDPQLAAGLAGSCSGIPYYLHKVVGRLGLEHSEIPRINIEDLVFAHLDSNDWETDHYFRRIDKYYPGDAALVVYLLDTLAADGPTSVDDLHRLATSRFFQDPPDRQRVGEVLDKLRLDHYLAYLNSEYAFVTEFLLQAWIRMRRRLG